MVAIVAGVLLLFDPWQTLTLISVIVGIWLVVAGFADLIGALAGLQSGSRVWGLLRGAFSVLVGAFLIINPERSLELLVIIACAWLIGYGFMTVVAALQLRSQRTT